MSRESCCLGLAACDKLVVASESDELKGRLLRWVALINGRPDKMSNIERYR